MSGEKPPSFSFNLSKKRKTVAAEENEKEVVSVEDSGQEAEDVLLGASVSIPPSVVLHHSPGDQLLSIYIEVLSMFTLKCFWYLCASIIY